ncbi:hypothetical protein ACVWZK_005426 [Bradyrhizobium sp. GM0.4]
MIKALSAIAISACVAATLTLLPGFAPTVEASVPQPLAKSDRLDIRTVGKDCSQQAWPNFEASCLRQGRHQSQHPRGSPCDCQPYSVVGVCQFRVS